MIDYAKRLRAGALLAAMAVVGFQVVVGMGHFGILLARGMRLAAAAQQSAASSVPLIWVFLVLALALACTLVRPQVLHARQLVTAAAGVVSVATVFALVLWVFGLFGGPSLGSVLAAVGGLIETFAKAACALVLWRLRVLVDEQPPPPEQPGQQAQQQGRQPTWDPKQAVGVQWQRAGDAATGAAAPQLPAQPATASEPQPVLRPEPKQSRQLWSRGGRPPEQLPWTTASQAASGTAPAGPADELPEPEERARRPAPDWTPARPPVTDES